MIRMLATISVVALLLAAPAVPARAQNASPLVGFNVGMEDLRLFMLGEGWVPFASIENSVDSTQRIMTYVRSDATNESRERYYHTYIASAEHGVVSGSETWRYHRTPKGKRAALSRYAQLRDSIRAKGRATMSSTTSSFYFRYTQFRDSESSVAVLAMDDYDADTLSTKPFWAVTLQRVQTTHPKPAQYDEVD